MKSFTAQTPFLLRILVIFEGLFLCGCSATTKSASPNAEYYSLVLLQKPAPSAQQIFTDGLIYQSSKPVSETWKECLKIATQSQGVLMMDDTDPDSPRMVIACGLPTTVTAPTVLFKTKAKNLVEDFDRNEKPSNAFKQYIRFMDVWLAVAVKPGILPGTSKIAVAHYDATRQAIQPFPAAPATEKGASTSEGGLANAFSKTWNKSPAFRSAATSNWADPKNSPELRWKSVPLLAADEFLMNFETQSTSPEIWAAKFKHSAPLASRGQPPGIQKENPPDMSLISQHGNWCATYLRRTVYMLDCPQVVAELTEISRQILKSAGAENKSVQIFIIASPDINAFSLPNGDIYVCAGLLDMLSDSEEVAAVLAHEIDHYLQQDATRKICSDYTTRKTIEASTFLLSKAVSVAASLATAGAASGLGGSVASSASDLASSAGTLANVFSQYSTMAVGSAVHRSFVMGFSQDTELRADANAVRYAWAAGYDPNVFPRIFDKLEQAELTYKEQQQLACSNLINCKPGIAQRKSQSQARLKELTDTNH